MFGFPKKMQMLLNAPVPNGFDGNAAMEFKAISKSGRIMGKKDINGDGRCLKLFFISSNVCPCPGSIQIFLPTLTA